MREVIGKVPAFPGSSFPAVSTMKGTFGDAEAQFAFHRGKFQCSGGNYTEQRNLMEAGGEGTGTHYLTDFFPEKKGYPVYEVKDGEKARYLFASLNNPSRISRHNTLFKRDGIEGMGYSIQRGEGDKISTAGEVLLFDFRVAEMYVNGKDADAGFLANWAQESMGNWSWADRQVVKRQVEYDWGERFKGEYEAHRGKYTPPDLDKYITPFGIAFARANEGKQFESSTYFKKWDKYLRALAEAKFKGEYDFILIAMRTSHQVKD